jgi:hypothetical protein
VTLEKAGIPTATVVTEPFGFKARREVEALGMGELPIVVLPHPIGQMPVEEMKVVTDAFLDEFMYIFTASADELKRNYTDRTVSSLPELTSVQAKKVDVNA